MPFSTRRPRSCWRRPDCRIPATPARSFGPRPPPAPPASCSTSPPPIRGAGRRCARRWAAHSTCRCCAAAAIGIAPHGMAPRGPAHCRHGAARRHADARHGLHEADGAAARRRRRRPARELVESADVRVTIPMRGGIESLNAAVAAAVLLYEAQRQTEACQSDRSRTPSTPVSLFDEPPAPVDPKTVPLAERMRPRTLDEIVGQDELVAPGRPLREMIDRDQLTVDHPVGTAGHRQDHAGAPDRRSHEGGVPRLQRRAVGHQGSQRRDGDRRTAAAHDRQAHHRLRRRNPSLQQGAAGCVPPSR